MALTTTYIYAMAQSLSHLIVHAVFSTKDRRALLRSEEIRSETYSDMAGIFPGRGDQGRFADLGVRGRNRHLRDRQRFFAGLRSTWRIDSSKWAAGKAPGGSISSLDLMTQAAQKRRRFLGGRQRSQTLRERD